MALQTIQGMKVLDETPGLAGGQKVLSIRRTGKYADPADGTTGVGMGGARGLAGSQLSAADQMMHPSDLQNRSVFESNLGLYI